TRGRLETREHMLAQTLSAARAEHQRLKARAAVKELAYLKVSHAVARQQKANAALQTRINARVEDIGSLQREIALSRSANRQLVAFLDGAAKRLARGAEDTTQDPALAGLLAVEAYRVTPYSGDDAAHPEVY